MRSHFEPPSVFDYLHRAPPVTKRLCAALVIGSVITAMLGRYGMPGPQLWSFDAARVLQGELWRLFTYAFVQDNPLSLLFDALALFILGQSCESLWGGRDFLRFFATSTVGAALLALPVAWLISHTLPFEDAGYAQGPSAAILALLVALMLRAPGAKVLFGFVLPLSAQASIGLILGLYTVSGLMSGTAHLAPAVGGAIMGYVLVTGIWRPQIFLAAFNNWRRHRRRGDLYVVKPRGKHTLN